MTYSKPKPWVIPPPPWPDWKGRVMEKHEYLPEGVTSLGEGWSYAASDFNNGWILFRDGQFLRTSDGHPILFPSVLTIRTWLHSNYKWADPFNPAPSGAGIVPPG